MDVMLEMKLKAEREDNMKVETAPSLTTVPHDREGISVECGGECERGRWLVDGWKEKRWKMKTGAGEMKTRQGQDESVSSASFCHFASSMRGFLSCERNCAARICRCKRKHGRRGCCPTNEET